MHEFGIGSLFESEVSSVLAEMLLCIVLLIPIIFVTRSFTRELFKPTWTRWLYAAPLIALLVLPFHYSLPLPLPVYALWMTVSVLWQDYLTFGLLQTYLERAMNSWAAALLTAGVFWLGHALLIPHRFGFTEPAGMLFILAIGLFIALLRKFSANLNLILSLHLLFYFVLA